MGSLLLFLALSVTKISVWFLDFCGTTNTLWHYAVYENRTEINVCISDESPYILIHELWHHFRHSMLSQEDRDEYIDIYKSTSWYITEYWKKSASEDFAELFSLVYINYHSNRSYNKITEWSVRKLEWIASKIALSIYENKPWNWLVLSLLVRN